MKQAVLIALGVSGVHQQRYLVWLRTLLLIVAYIMPQLAQAIIVYFAQAYNVKSR